jgi:hypothetical protein
VTTTTNNPGWGFYGTMAGHAEQAWPLAVEIITRTTHEPEADVGTFLDSTYGRHFADEVQDELRRGHNLALAIERTAAAWQDRRIGRSSSRYTGIPHGTPSLSGYVIAAAIHAEQEAE